MVEESISGLIAITRTSCSGTDMMVNGWIANDKVLEPFIIIMGLNMMVIGKITKEMVLEFLLKKLEI